MQAYGHYKRDLLLNLQPMIDASQVFDPVDYPVELFDVWRLDGENLYALPENLQSMSLYYNTTIFDQAGATVPDDTWTWDQVVEAGKALTVRDGDRVSQYGLDVGTMRSGGGRRRSVGPRETPSSTASSSRPSSRSPTRRMSPPWTSCRAS